MFSFKTIRKKKQQHEGMFFTFGEEEHLRPDSKRRSRGELAEGGGDDEVEAE